MNQVKYVSITTGKEQRIKLHKNYSNAKVEDHMLGLGFVRKNSAAGKAAIKKRKEQETGQK